MIHSLSTVVAETEESISPEVTVRCRIKSNPMPGEAAGSKTVYLVEDPHGSIDSQVALSFWSEEPKHSGLKWTEPHVRRSLQIPTVDELEENKYSPDSTSLQRGEEILARVVPNWNDGDETLFLNVTSFVIREPDRLISKSKLRTQKRCSREHYLRYVKRVYPGDRFDKPPYKQANQFRGDAIHTITEHALIEHLDRFQQNSWTPKLAESFCKDQFESEFGFRQALLVLSGAGLDVREHVVDAVTRLFTDNEFSYRIADAEEIAVEQYLSGEYGYAGRVDILLDGTPYDLKTTRNVDADTVATHSHQIKLYLFALLLERLDQGESFQSAIESGQRGYLVYPNAADCEGVRIEEVQLSDSDVREFLTIRNDVVGTGDAFAPPPTYNRDCDNCAFAVEEWITGKDDTLPPACTYHCQNERRWDCYETGSSELTSECSLFNQCDQRTEYRDPEAIAHYEATRAAFRSERSARKNVGKVMKQFDDDVLTQAGHRIANLRCTGASAAGTIIRFSTPDPVVPTFEPGETVFLGSKDNEYVRAFYYGKADEEYLFSPLDDQLSISQFLAEDSSYEAIYRFNTDTIDDRYLPYLDFAQRRNNGDPISGAGDKELDNEATEIAVVSEIVRLLDKDHVFVDLPVGRSRNERLAKLVRELVTGEYFDEYDDTIPEPARRALVLGTRPHHVELASDAQPDGDHYRLDGTGGPARIQSEDGYHEIQNQLLNSRSIVSSVQQATSKSGPGGLREFFHRLTEGDFGNRDHSGSFFDVLVLLGAHNLTEPEYYFLSDVADHVVAVGDTRQSGPQMVSTDASDANLGSFFKQEFERYSSFPSTTAVSIQLNGEAPPALQEFYREGPWEVLDGKLTFLNIEGDEETAVDTVKFEMTVPSATGNGRQLVFDIADTPLSPMKAHGLFGDLIELDATALREDSVVVLNDESLYLRSKDRLEGEATAQHQVIIQAVASELPEFSRALLSNRIAEQIVTEVANEENPDLIVTPFERHATEIKRRLKQEEIDVPVRRPEALDGTVAGEAIVSLATSNSDGIVRPPLDDPAVLYSLLSSAQDLTLIGNKSTLRSKDIFEKLIKLATPYNS